MKKSLNYLYDDFFKPAKPTTNSTPTFSNEEAVSKEFPKEDSKLEKYILGQNNAIELMNQALVRPTVMDHKFNTILLCGPKGTGKHTLIQRFHEYLYTKSFFKKKDPSYINLNQITDEDTLIQDIYNALQTPNQIIVFENIETCDLTLLSIIKDLCEDGLLSLKKRYSVQKDKLALETNHLSKNLVSSLQANHHYFVLLGDQSKNSLTSLLGNQMISCIKDIIETKSLSKEVQMKLIEKDLIQLSQSIIEKFNISLEITNSSKDFLSHYYNEAEGYYGIKNAINKLHQEITTYLINHDEKKCIIDYVDELKINDYVLFKENNLLEELNAIQKEMDEIVGLEEVKQYIYSLRDYIAISKRRKSQGLKVDEITMHMIFTGNPGTGKTTIARLMAKYLKALEVLKNGQLIEVTRADLVASYVGQTAPKTKKVIETSLGGVLFIDEAYSLFRGKEDSFGLEAIDMLVKSMEDYRDQLVVILAGYTKEMNEFLEANSGLKSRFANTIEFPDYTAEQLLQIAISIATKKQYQINNAAQTKLLSYFEHIQSLKDHRSGNGRLARNVVEDAILKQASRISRDLNASLTELTSEDFCLDA